MWTRLFSLCLALALCLHTGLAQECDDGYELFPAFPGSRYKMPPVRLSWLDAFYVCQSDGGGSHLVVINSEQEAEAVKELMLRTDRYAFVGINDLSEEGTWVTIQGTQVALSGYAVWMPGEPSGNYDCGAVVQNALYLDRPCDFERQFICEKPNN